MSLREWYNGLHRITGSMAMMGVNPVKATKEEVQGWAANLKAIVKEMDQWIKNLKDSSAKPKSKSTKCHPKKKKK